MEEVFCQTFTAGVPGIGEVRMEPLIPGGEDNFVNEENRREYVDAYVDFYLNRSVQRQFEVLLIASPLRIVSVCATLASCQVCWSLSGDRRACITP